jgi:hypothetical protein
MCRRNRDQSQLGTPQRRSHRGGEDTWSRDAGRKRSRLSQTTHGYRPDIDCEHAHPRFPPRLLIVLNHGHWLLFNIGRFSIDECSKDEQFVHQDPTHRHFIAPPHPAAATLSCVLVSKSLASCRSRSWLAGSPLMRFTIRPRCTAGRLAIASVQRWTFFYSATCRNSDDGVGLPDTGHFALTLVRTTFSASLCNNRNTATVSSIVR